ncbi:GNAT family N-acetyltransferase [Streptomyces sp. NPDC005820]|uniref:GNAT family N-acetyltransferase n=1 Tax=Streptomyces sp. NPDC005820 TaxID=3157069 RepID=UPI00340F8EF0
MTDYGVRPLGEDTWPDFARLVERHNGVWGGCWCMAFHEEGVGGSRTSSLNREDKEARVRSGRAHAALVYDGPECVGWCQFGPVDELPRIKHRRAYLAGREGGPRDPADWRITCFFVARDHRRRGVAAAALDGALHEIARLGGGSVESYPEDTADRSVSASFLHNGTLALFEGRGFTPVRRLGKHHWVVTRAVAGPATGEAAGA